MGELELFELALCYSKPCQARSRPAFDWLYLEIGGKLTTDTAVVRPS